MRKKKKERGKKVYATFVGTFGNDKEHTHRTLKEARLERSVFKTPCDLNLTYNFSAEISFISFLSGNL